MRRDVPLRKPRSCIPLERSFEEHEWMERREERRIVLYPRTTDPEWIRAA